MTLVSRVLRPWGAALLLGIAIGCASTPPTPAPAPSPVVAAPSACSGAPPAGRIISALGGVKVQPAAATTEVDGGLGYVLCQGDTVRTGPHTRAGVVLANGAMVRLAKLSTLQLTQATANSAEVSRLQLERGRLHSFSRRPMRFDVTTPTAVLGVRGTEFLVSADRTEAAVTVLEGEVDARNSAGSVSVGSGSMATVRAGLAPTARTVVRPRDQVQWSLYYPPVYSFDADVDPGVAGSAAARALAPAQVCATAGNLACALEAMGKVPASARQHRYHLLNAALLLAIGEIADAGAAIDEARRLQPRDGNALAMRAVISVVTGDTAQALQQAREAVALNAADIGPRIALSYAQQAALDLAGAQQTLVEVVRAHPDDALAHARLAELQLSRGLGRQAFVTAQRAVQLGPDLSRAQLALGFVALARLQLDVAQAAFERAVALDSADPLARLGMGLGKIRRGQLAAGRVDLEAAVALSANDSVLRSYLGKAYFEEDRRPLDSEQFAQARTLDPNDPTPYLYEGVLNQSTNRPVEGLRNLAASIDRNDNRAVYRSRQLLDQDRAARGTSQARIYNSLGFQTLGINEATASLGKDPANAGAHRFLSDSYRALPRREVARVSELLQAQMLQDTNINPTQPSVSSTSLNIASSGGPTSSGFSEFNNLFERDRVAFNVTGMAGSDDLKNGEAVLSGVRGGFSGSAGLYRFETDGFRANNQLEHEIVDIYGQIAVTPELNLQAEYRDRHTERGDLAINFDPAMFDANLREEVEDRNLRFGLRYSPGPRTSVLLSYIRSDRELDGSTTQQQVQMLPFPPDMVPPAFFITVAAEGTQTSQQSNDADQYGGLVIYQADRFNVTGGIEVAKTETRGDIAISTVFTVTPPIFEIPPDAQVFSVDADTDDRRGYVYASIDLLAHLTATVGVSYQDVDSTLFKFDRVNPKIGLAWDATDRLRLRLAYFQSVKPSLASNRTLEPSQVAGFNQLYDESDGTRSARTAAAIDFAVTPSLFVGIEGGRRMLEQPVFNLTTRTAGFEDRDERTDLVYLNWTPNNNFALRLEGIFDEFTKDDPSPAATGISRLETFSAPLTASFFHPNGVFASLGMTYVDQRVVREGDTVLPSGSDQFTTVDLGVGYRLPRRRGIISLMVRNLLDEDLLYQDDSFRTFQDEPSGSPFLPTRTVLGSFTLSF